jgi:hypothetical protein
LIAQLEDGQRPDIVRGNLPIFVEWLNSEDLDIQNRSADILRAIQADAAAVEKIMWEVIEATRVTPIFLRLLLELLQERRAPRSLPRVAVERQLPGVERDALLVYLGRDDIVSDALERCVPGTDYARPLERFAKLAANATPDGIRNVLASRRFLEVVSDASGRPADAAVLLGAVIGPPPLVSSEMTVQLLLGKDASSSLTHLQQTGRFAGQIVINEAVFPQLQYAVMSILAVREPELSILGRLVPVMAEFVAANPGVVMNNEFDAQKLTRFLLAQAAWASESREVAKVVLKYVTQCARLSSRLGIEMESRLMQESPTAKHTAAWGMVSAAVAAALDGKQFVAAVDRIIAALAAAPDECWVNFVEQVRHDTQNADGPWVSQILEQMLATVSITMLESPNGKRLFEGIFRTFDTRLSAETKERIVQRIRGTHRHGESARLDILKNAWTWSG